MTRRNSAARTAALLAATVLTLGLTLAGCAAGTDWPSAGAPSASAAPPLSADPSAAAGTPPVDDPSPGAAGGDGAQGANASRCTTAELRGSLGPADGAAGSVNQTLVLTNTGNRTCTLRGFPGVSYVGGDDGRQVGPSAVMQGARGGDIRLAPGGSAGAPLQLTNVTNFDERSCRPTAVRGLRVYPPGDTSSLFVAREGTGCAGTPSGGNQLSVRTLAAG